MPYIEHGYRTPIKEALKVASKYIHTQGELTYAITVLMHAQVKRLGAVRYASLSSVRAAAQDAADEFYRVVMAKHEDKKRRENGPVSDLDALTLEDVR